MIPRSIALFCLPLLALLVGCDASPSTEPLDEDDGPPVFSVDLLITDEYDGNPRELSVSLFSSLPPMGPPNYSLFAMEAPELVAGEAFEIELYDGLPEDGSYHVYAVVYDVAGGTWVPTEGVDLVGETDPLLFDGSTVEVGPVDMNYR
ncbi:MAG TPA: hypothetical protein DIU15_11630 [Deltaproteobacteria bacterium]|nr:hypothetical protein [Deltaproteobacteria bacterium]HCP46688.1 hypothetical protein [Deltaproteobacteria bacterium]